MEAESLRPETLNPQSEDSQTPQSEPHAQTLEINRQNNSYARHIKTDTPEDLGFLILADRFLVEGGGSAVKCLGFGTSGSGLTGFRHPMSETERCCVGRLGDTCHIPETPEVQGQPAYRL